MLCFTLEVFCRLANQNRGHIRVMLEYHLIQPSTLQLPYIVPLMSDDNDKVI